MATNVLGIQALIGRAHAHVWSPARWAGVHASRGRASRRESCTDPSLGAPDAALYGAPVPAVVLDAPPRLAPRGFRAVRVAAPSAAAMGDAVICLPIRTVQPRQELASRDPVEDPRDWEERACAQFTES